MSAALPADTEGSLLGYFESLPMSGTNRIRRYEKVWQPAADAAPGVPAGFVMLSLAGLPPAVQQQALAQRSIYERAYAEAQAEADRRFVLDWII